MEKIGFMKVSGVCAILTGIVAAAGFIIIIAATDVLDANGAAEILTAAHKDSRAAAGALWLFVLAPLLAVMAVLGFYQALREEGNLIRVAAVFFFLGIPLGLSRVFLDLGLVYELAPGYAISAANSDTSASLMVVADTMDVIGLLADLVANVLMIGIGVMLFSVAIIRSSFIHTWIGWLGVAVALVGGWLPLLGPAFSLIEIIGSIGFFFFMAWMIAMGINLLRLEEPAVPT